MPLRELSLGRQHYPSITHRSSWGTPPPRLSLILGHNPRTKPLHRGAHAPHALFVLGQKPPTLLSHLGSQAPHDVLVLGEGEGLGGWEGLGRPGAQAPHMKATSSEGTRPSRSS